MEKLKKNKFLTKPLCILFILVSIIVILISLYRPRHIHQEMISESYNGEYVHLTLDLTVYMRRYVEGRLFFEGTEYRVRNNFVDRGDFVDKGIFRNHGIWLAPYPMMTSYLATASAVLCAILVLEFDDLLDFTEITIHRLCPGGELSGEIIPQHFHIYD